ncbi:unnamed protein product [Camellia sinensis]
MVSNNQLFHLFLFLCFSQITCLHAQLCTQEQSSALLQFKQQFSFNKSASDCDHSYPKMESWKEGSDCCSWDGVECDNNTSQVIGLDLSCSWLLGTIHPNSTIFYYFPHLQSLNLAFNHFGMSRISSEFSRFTRLTHLNLSGSVFSGKVPIEVSFLSKLVSLDLSYNYGLRLEEPGFELLVQNLTKVRELNLGEVNISSVVSISLLNLTSLTRLDLSSCGLLGKFPDGIFLLPHLNELLISYNLALTGYFPEFINSSSPLQYLRLLDTNFSGELPDSIGNLKSLKTLYAVGCKFYGSIPTSLGNLTEMTRLAISYNNFTGMLPSSLSNLGNLVKLGVQYNNFEGKIADVLPNAKSLMYLYVGSNSFSGPFPSLVANLTSLVELDLSNNQLTGPLPSWVFSLPALHYFNLSNNKLTGHVKEFKSTDLIAIDLSNNSLYGRFPSSTFKLVNLTSLILSSNNFSGELDMLCHAVSLRLRVLSSNSFNGSIPQCLGNFSTYFSVLDLRKNNFSGTIPNTFVKGNSFEIINLNGNGFEGTVPKSLVNCKMLRVVDLGCNKFSDKFPFWLEKLRWLQVLILSSNKFHGPMPASKAKFPFLNLRVMDLSDNYFTGPLPKTYFKNFNAMMNVIEANFKLQYIEKSVVGSMYLYAYHYHDCLTMVIKGSTIEMAKVLTIFTVIDLSKNNFEGQIPQIIGKLNSIRGLNLSHNSLTGHIPTSLANLAMLEWLDLSSNKLTGEIPRQLNNLKSLAVFNLSQNQLIGPIPQGNQFDTFLDDSYIGNLALCGPPLSNTCSDPRPPQQEDDMYSSSGFNWYVILLGYGCGLVWGLVMGYVMFSKGKPQWLVRIIEGERNESRKRFKKHAHRNRGSWLAVVELGLLKGRHPLLKDVNVTLNPSKGLAWRRGLEKVIPQLASVQDSDVILVNPEIEHRGLQQKSNGTLEQAYSVDAVLVKDKGNPIDDERGQVLQTAQVAMNMLDVTMTGTLTEEQKQKKFLPKMSLIASDFSFLPDVKVPGERAALVSTKKNGNSSYYSSYLNAKVVEMLVNMGIPWVILGHSERRALVK